MPEKKEAQAVGPISPFFIVDDVAVAVAFYERLGFHVRHSQPAEGPFFAVVGRGAAQLLLKHVSDVVHPQPNHARHEWAPWDAYVSVDDPDALAAELEARDVRFHRGLGDREDGLRGFEIRDEDGYVLFFGRPR